MGASPGPVALVQRADFSVVRAKGSRRFEAVCRTGRRNTVAHFFDVAVARVGPAQRAAVSCRMHTRTGAVALVGRARFSVVGTDRPRRLEAVGRARDRQAVAHFFDVAVAGIRPANRAAISCRMGA